jgi:hypothetical protein
VLDQAADRSGRRRRRRAVRVDLEVELGHRRARAGRLQRPSSNDARRWPEGGERDRARSSPPA